MEKITFKAESKEELFQEIEKYYKEALRKKAIKDKFLKKNPIGSIVISNSNLKKNYPRNSPYSILDVGLNVNEDILILLQGDNGVNNWQHLKWFKGINK